MRPNLLVVALLAARIRIILAAPHARDAEIETPLDRRRQDIQKEEEDVSVGGSVSSSSESHTRNQKRQQTPHTEPPRTNDHILLKAADEDEDEDDEDEDGDEKEHDDDDDNDDNDEYHEDPSIINLLHGLNHLPPYTIGNPQAAETWLRTNGYEQGIHLFLQESNLPDTGHLQQDIQANSRNLSHKPRNNQHSKSTSTSTGTSTSNSRRRKRNAARRHHSKRLISVNINVEWDKHNQFMCAIGVGILIGGLILPIAMGFKLGAAVTRFGGTRKIARAIRTFVRGGKHKRKKKGHNLTLKESHPKVMVIKEGRHRKKKTGVKGVVVEPEVPTGRHRKPTPEDAELDTAQGLRAAKLDRIGDGLEDLEKFVKWLLWVVGGAGAVYQWCVKPYL